LVEKFDFKLEHRLSSQVVLGDIPDAIREFKGADGKEMNFGQ
jgi:hypothetical protein